MQLLHRGTSGPSRLANGTVHHRPRPTHRVMTALLTSHTAFVLDVSSSMAQADVTEAGTNVKRCSAVNKAAREFLAQQIADGPGPRDTCSLITFNSQATVWFQGRRVGSDTLDAIKQAEQAEGWTTYVNALDKATRLITSTPADVHCVVFLSDGEDNHPSTALLQTAISGLVTACQPGQLQLHAIGFGPQGSTFEWLEKMADMSKGKFHKNALVKGQMSSEALCVQFRGMSQMLTQVRTSSPRKKSLPLRGNPSSSSLLSAPAPAAPVTTGCSWPLSGDLLAWDTASQGFKLAQQAVTLLVSTPHFATGSTRLAYRATASSPAAATSLPSGPLVVKAAQDTSDQELELQAPYFACLHTAQSAAQAFPRLPAATTPKFVDCQLLRCSTEGSQRFLAVEQLLEGAYIKYNGNKGYVAPLPDDAHGREGYELAQAFSHWSWVHSGGRELVCDIQGVGARWTDPQVNSVAVKYGHKDMGAEGIAAFFASHRCNGYCHALNISNNRPAA
ncbi:kinase-like domain-containing protein [Haematococcus lacustris]